MTEGVVGLLGSPNARRFFAGQAVSLIGTWMQHVAFAWLVLEVSGSGTVLGLVVAAQMLPVLLLGPFGGVLADRFDKRAILVVGQSVLASVSLVMGLVVRFGDVRLWMVFAASIVVGCMNACVSPTRQSFVPELVGRHHVLRAVSLNNVLVNGARAVGPPIAGALIVWSGTAACFFIDAGSYAFAIAGLLLLQRAELGPATRSPRARGQVREAVAHVREHRSLFVPLVMMAIIGTFAYEFQVLLPLVAVDTFRGGPGMVGTISAAQGCGAVLGGLAVVRWGRTGLRSVVASATVFGVAMLLAASAPNLGAELIALALVGASSISFLSSGNSTLQLAAEPRLRGRVMALWTTAFVGSTPIGGPIVGWLAQHGSPRVGLAVGGTACLVASAVAVRVGRPRPQLGSVDAGA